MLAKQKAKDDTKAKEKPGLYPRWQDAAVSVAESEVWCWSDLGFIFCGYTSPLMGNLE